MKVEDLRGCMRCPQASATPTVSRTEPTGCGSNSIARATQVLVLVSICKGAILGRQRTREEEEQAIPAIETSALLQS